MLKGDVRVAGFVCDTTWESLPKRVQKQARKCAIDLIGALSAGTMTKTAAIMANMSCSHFPGTDATIISGGGKASLPGAALANGFAINAFDVDDGHRLIKGHPGAAVFPALMAVGEYKDIAIGELLTTLVVSYEVAIRAGLALHKHYNFYHGSGSWGAIGAAAGAARILGLDESQTIHAMGTAEYHAPLAPVMRPVQMPSMNKDGIGWGNMAGMLSALMAKDGFTGAPGVLGFPEYDDLTDSLGTEYKMMDLYFKPYTCCRWAHPSINAIIDLKNKHALTPADVQDISILTFSAAASLYSGKPKTTEEAQYNVLYPAAAAFMSGEVGPRQVLESYFSQPEVLALMDRMRIKSDTRFDKVFPSERLCEVMVTTVDGRVLCSGVYGPVGEPENPVSMDWVTDKFHGLTQDVLDKARAEEIITLLSENLEGGKTGSITELVRACTVLHQHKG